MDLHNNVFEIFNILPYFWGLFHNTFNLIDVNCEEDENENVIEKQTSAVEI